MNRTIQDLEEIDMCEVNIEEVEDLSSVDSTIEKLFFDVVDAFTYSGKRSKV